MAGANKGSNGLKIFGILSSIFTSIFLIIIIVILLIYFLKIRKNNSQQVDLIVPIDNSTNTNIAINNSTSNGIKDLKITFSVDGSKIPVKGFISDTVLIDEINRQIKSNMLNIMLFSRVEQPVINYEYTIEYPDKTLKYLTSNTDQIKYLLLSSLPTGTTVVETGISGSGIISTYKVPTTPNNTGMINTIKDIFI